MEQEFLIDSNILIEVRRNYLSAGSHPELVEGERWDMKSYIGHTARCFPACWTGRDGAQHDSLSHIAFVSKDVGIVKKNNANDCRNLEADFNEGEADKTAGRESGLWVEASFCLDFLVTFSSRKK